MPTAPGTFRPDNQTRDERERERKREFDRYREPSHVRGYNHRWRKARATYLRSHPLCAMCWADGVATPATVVDHITPHKGDSTLFWDTNNWQALCKRHHDEKTAREDSNFGTPDGRKG
ncbi:HNH endonuclease signature motif containing protein [Rhodomicrobium lacus]|uniref:HNH endonuclease signature motif containing protein n=1 Tax=Rhodomicrobium lacus TaxID=2498452 RepID=UPI000F8C5D3E|nr:HNH endonuclease signature motif containing protein [Rhodomicrobium lacus]